MSQNCFAFPFHRHTAATTRVAFFASLSLLACSMTAWGQRPVHYQYNIDMPPGAIGARQLMNNYPFRGYTQPVKIQVPEGADVSVACDGAFQFPSPTLRVGVLVGHVYRLKVSNIPRHEDVEVYPSLEIINRLHPPKGMKARFPVPIDIAQEDLELAIAGKMVVRVIYVENPEEAFPKSEDGTHQRYFDALPEEDPLQVADQLGRPIAILRLGSRMPNYSGPDNEFLFGSPPVSLMSNWTEPIVVEVETSPPVIPEVFAPGEAPSIPQEIPPGDATIEAPNILTDPAEQQPSSSDVPDNEDLLPLGEDDPFIDDNLN